MMPPFARRCPNCGYFGLTHRFEHVSDADQQLVECPSCGHQFETGDDPWLAALRLRS